MHSYKATQHLEHSDKRIVLLGKIGHGKTYVLNKVCDGNSGNNSDDGCNNNNNNNNTKFQSNMSSISCTRNIQIGYTKQYGICIVDTPGFYSSTDVQQHINEQRLAIESNNLYGIYLIVKFGRVDDIIQSIEKLMDFVNDDNYIRIIITHCDDCIKEQNHYNENDTIEYISELLDISTNSILLIGKETLPITIEEFIVQTLVPKPKRMTVCKDQLAYIASFTVGIKKFDKTINTIQTKLDIATKECHRIVTTNNVTLTTSSNTNEKNNTNNNMNVYPISKTNKIKDGYRNDNDMMINKSYTTDLAISVIQSLVIRIVLNAKEQIMEGAKDLTPEQQQLFQQSNTNLTLGATTDTISTANETNRYPRYTFSEFDDNKKTNYNNINNNNNNVGCLKQISSKLDEFLTATNQYYSWNIYNLNDRRNQYKQCNYCAKIYKKSHNSGNYSLMMNQQHEDEYYNKNNINEGNKTINETSQKQQKQHIPPPLLEAKFGSNSHQDDGEEEYTENDSFKDPITTNDSSWYIYYLMDGKQVPTTTISTIIPSKLKHDNNMLKHGNWNTTRLKKKMKHHINTKFQYNLTSSSSSLSSYPPVSSSSIVCGHCISWSTMLPINPDLLSYKNTNKVNTSSTTRSCNTKRQREEEEEEEDDYFEFHVISRKWLFLASCFIIVVIAVSLKTKKEWRSR